jgi:hypothetical protein
MAVCFYGSAINQSSSFSGGEVRKLQRLVAGMGYAHKKKLESCRDFSGEVKGKRAWPFF